MKTFWDIMDPPVIVGKPARDPCARKHGGNEQSKAAWDRVKATVREEHQRILAWLALQVKGGTAKEYARFRRVDLNVVSGRFSELLAAKRIERTGERRDGSSVCRLKAIS